jgi:hypothetical protein
MALRWEMRFRHSVIHEYSSLRCIRATQQGMANDIRRALPRGRGTQRFVLG